MRLLNNSFFGKIYVSIASFMDSELELTVKSILSKAKLPANLYVVIFSQDNDDSHPNLDTIFKKYNANYEYIKVNHSESNGVGMARSVAQSFLTKSYKYYLQVDSHTQFYENWDIKLISDYETAHETMGTIIFSSYPPGYDYQDDGSIKYNDDGTPPFVKIVKKDNLYGFDPLYDSYPGSDIGEYSGYFCAGLAFGRSEYFLKVPYDNRIYFGGEEHTMSIRFFDKGINIVCPPRTYLSHNYNGDKRTRHWEINSNRAINEQISIETINDFFAGRISDQYGVSSLKTINNWLDKHISDD